jgi:nucleotide-binding universal stress UspA family protein
MYQRILVPVDGSHTSTLGLQEAIRLAIDQRARLRLVHVVDELLVAQNFEGYINAGDLINSLEESGKKTLQKAVALTRTHHLKAEASLFETVGGRVADVIIREARKWKADLIVMGTHGRRGFGRMVLGSDAEAILRETRVPVLLVRAPDRKKRAASK